VQRWLKGIEPPTEHPNKPSKTRNESAECPAFRPESQGDAVPATTLDASAFTEHSGNIGSFTRYQGMSEPQHICVILTSELDESRKQSMVSNLLREITESWNSPSVEIITYDLAQVEDFGTPQDFHHEIEMFKR
jgi:hypothetical protein